MSTPLAVMKILSWNIQGLRKLWTRLVVKKILQLHQPEIFFYCETKMKAQHVNLICWNFNFENCFVVDKDGLGGHLTLFWTLDVNVEIKSYSSHHKDIVVQNESGVLWRCIAVYGHLEANKKYHTWTLLKRLVGLFSYLWYCFGDFNEIFTYIKSRGETIET